MPVCVAIGTNRNAQSVGNDPSRLHYLVTDLPDDITLVAMVDPQNQAGVNTGKAMLNVYATDAAPLGPMLSVRGSLGAPELGIVPASDGTNFVETSIDGKRAAFADGTSSQRLLYIETNGHWVQFESRNIDDATLEEMAKAAVWNVDGSAAIPTSSLVDGLKLVLATDAPLDDLVGGIQVARADYASAGGQFGGPADLTSQGDNADTERTEFGLGSDEGRRCGWLRRRLRKTRRTHRLVIFSSCCGSEMVCCSSSGERTSRHRADDCC